MFPATVSSLRYIWAMKRTVQKFESMSEADEASAQEWAEKSPEEKIRVTLELRALRNGGDETVERCVLIYPMKEVLDEV